MSSELLNPRVVWGTPKLAVGVKILVRLGNLEDFALNLPV